MKKLIILIISLSFGYTLLGQNSFPFPSPSYSYQEAAPPKAYYVSDWSLGLAIKSSAEHLFTKNLDQSKISQFKYRPKFSYELELFIERKVSSNWIRVFGVSFHGVSFEYDNIQPVIFSKTGNPNVDGVYQNQYNLIVENAFEEIDFTATAEYSMFGDNNDYEDGEELDFRISSVNKLQFLGIPFGLKRVFSFKKLSFTAKGGFEPTVLLNKKISYDHYHQSGFYIEGDRPNHKYRKVESERVELKEITINSQINKLKRLGLFGFLNVGFIHSHRYHSFFMEVEYKQGLSNISQKNASTSFLNSLGFRTGFIQRFKLGKNLDKPLPPQDFKW